MLSNQLICPELSKVLHFNRMCGNEYSHAKYIPFTPNLDLGHTDDKLIIINLLADPLGTPPDPALPAPSLSPTAYRLYGVLARADGEHVDQFYGFFQSNEKWIEVHDTDVREVDLDTRCCT